MSARQLRLAYGPHARQYILILEPQNSEAYAEMPWAVYFHGGAWTFGRPEAFRPAARPWLEAGYRVALPSYRRPPKARLPDIVEDCHAAMAELADFALRTHRPLCAPQLAGISAGGHLAAVLALHPNRWLQSRWPGPPTQALLCAPPLDLRLLSPSGIFKRYRGINPAEIKLPTPQPRLLLLHGTADGMVDYAHATSFVGTVTEQGGSIQLETIEGGGHLDAGRWTYDDDDPYAPLVRDFIRSAAPAPPGAG
jgi:acetyl esterase/lipase